MTAIKPISLGSRFQAPPAQMLIWQDLKAREIGEQLDSSHLSRISLQVEGNFSSGALSVEGSNDGEHWYTLLDKEDGYLTLTAPNMFDVGQLSRWLRPVVQGGDELTKLSVFALCRS